MPQRLNLEVLAALCGVLDCQPNDLMTPVAQPVQRGEGRDPGGRSEGRVAASDPSESAAARIDGVSPYRPRIICCSVCAERRPFGSRVFGETGLPALPDTTAGNQVGRSQVVAERIRVLERGTDMVLAAHRTAVRGRLVATTVETVHLVRPARVDVRLVRVPVPNVVERFVLTTADAGTMLEYSGELGTNLWWIGETVGSSRRRPVGAGRRRLLETIKAEVERRTAVGGCSRETRASRAAPGQVRDPRSHSQGPASPTTRPDGRMNGASTRSQANLKGHRVGAMSILYRLA